MSERKIIVVDDAQALYVHAAEEIAHIAGEAICMHGQFTLCLSGGSTPAAIYELMATRFRLSIDWKEVQFFWGDERCVPPDHPASNYAMTKRTMLDKLELKPSQVHRMRGEDPPEAGAVAYESDLRAAFGLDAGGQPRFDLILLGLGDNVHTASLFPGDRAIHEKVRIVAPVDVDADVRRRLTHTPPAINNAARAMFMAAGGGKAEAVKAAIEGPRDPDRYPAQIVAPVDGELIWLLDRAAAKLLSSVS